MLLHLIKLIIDSYQLNNFLKLSISNKTLKLICNNPQKELLRNFNKVLLLERAIEHNNKLLYKKFYDKTLINDRYTHLLWCVKNNYKSILKRLLEDFLLLGFSMVSYSFTLLPGSNCIYLIKYAINYGNIEIARIILEYLKNYIKKIKYPVLILKLEEKTNKLEKLLNSL